MLWIGFSWGMSCFGKLFSGSRPNPAASHSVLVATLPTMHCISALPRICKMIIIFLWSFAISILRWSAIERQPVLYFIRLTDEWLRDCVLRLDNSKHIWADFANWFSDCRFCEFIFFFKFFKLEQNIYSFHVILKLLNVRGCNFGNSI